MPKELESAKARKKFEKAMKLVSKIRVMSRNPASSQSRLHIVES